MFMQMMGNLPSYPMQSVRSFIKSGVDFCGHPCKEVALFCCFSTKAAYLEVVNDLSTDTFIGTLKILIGRHRRSQNLYYDNGIQFVRARCQKAELEQRIPKKCTAK